MRRTFSTMAWAGIGALSLIGMGCRNTTVYMPGPGGADLSTPQGGGADLTMPVGPGDDSGLQGDLAMGSGSCGGFMPMTIAAMRMGTANHVCAQLDNVISIGTTPSKTSPRMFVQDAAGGDFSAIMTRCSMKSTAHPCTIYTQVHGIGDGHNLSITGLFIRSKTTQFEAFYINSILVDNPGAALPQPATLLATEIQRAAMSAKTWFQRVTVNVSDPLVAYDWTPAEFVFSGATKCPYQFGFGMIPMSAGATPGAACPVGGAAQPAGIPNPSPQEVLIGTDFYTGLKLSSDCRCNSMFADKAPTATSTVSGNISGILVYDVPFMGTAGYQYFAPKSDADFPLTNTM